MVKTLCRDLLAGPFLPSQKGAATPSTTRPHSGCVTEAEATASLNGREVLSNVPRVLSVTIVLIYPISIPQNYRLSRIENNGEG